MTDSEKSNTTEIRKRETESADEEFAMRELPDLRQLRSAYLGPEGIVEGDDIPDTVMPEEESGRFKLIRSTREEAWLFYRENIECGEGEDDDLTELLDEL